MPFSPSSPPSYGVLQAEEEDRLLAQAEQITGARKAALLAKRPSGAPLLHPASFSNSVSEMPFFDHAVTPYAPPKPGVYLRRAALEESKKTALAQQAHGAKASKLLDTVMNDVAQVRGRGALDVLRALGVCVAPCEWCCGMCSTFARPGSAQSNVIALAAARVDTTLPEQKVRHVFGQKQHAKFRDEQPIRLQLRACRSAPRRTCRRARPWATTSRCTTRRSSWSS